MTGCVAAEICTRCQYASLEERGFCPRCGSRQVVVDDVPGEALLWSLTEIHRPPAAQDAQAEPYAVGVIALTAGPRLMARIPFGLAIGDAVIVDRRTFDAEAIVLVRSIANH